MTDAPIASVPAARLRSLDIFRGFVMASMLLVNSKIDADAFHWQFRHLGWNDGRQGASFCDLIFPWFLFAVGCAIPFSMSSGRGKDLTPVQRIARAARRGLVIYLLGVAIGAARSNKINLLSWDILQHIAVAYVIAVALWHAPRWARVVFIVAVLVLKHAMLRWIAYPGEGVVVWEEKKHLQQWISAWLAGVWSPLGWLGGLLNVLPGATVVLAGAFAAEVLRRADLPLAQRAQRLAIASAGLLVLAYLWRLDLEFSKDFFTSSYALLSAGSGGLILAAFFYLVDARKSALAGGARFFEVFGVNAIALYVAVEILWPMVLHRWTIPVFNLGGAGDRAALLPALALVWKSFIPMPIAAWVHGASYILLCWLGCWALDRKKIHIRV
ncbi:MAG: heparan-alpha-glucosaminide N-acetyltransferase domain-containing protein [Planctomycetota bacterium]|nr:heparan-alpha-glucosaminide N-acetyltransferase domain-containing protein [Planctomycetota bacterium]